MDIMVNYFHFRGIKYLIIDGRTKACLREMLNNYGNGSIVEMTFLNPHIGTVVPSKGSGISFLENTDSVMIR